MSDPHNVQRVSIVFSGPRDDRAALHRRNGRTKRRRVAERPLSEEVYPVRTAPRVQPVLRIGAGPAENYIATNVIDRRPDKAVLVQRHLVEPRVAVKGHDVEASSRVRTRPADEQAGTETAKIGTVDRSVAECLFAGPGGAVAGTNDVEATRAVGAGPSEHQSIIEHRERRPVKGGFTQRDLVSPIDAVGG